ncbi:hypothetical protein PR202_ga13249 [Eleusine coracana subsp. coracana]|uniref:3,4-dihydroxy-2-butanone kinase n=1 Tax=Eleusine coracana subsp. coracana TaxID=191504 RepID=A0AAV5CEA8_ELECO|nr:hypothetical protein PR202_ga13249 [Eleusine coracana subsp. coracana]
MAFHGKKLINDPDDVVTEFIEGLVETYPGLQYLDGFPEIKVVIRADVTRGAYEKVAVISGGGSGHEPAHAGFVGPGMLTAAVSGDVFASPPVDSILAAIRAVTGPMGCLLIVKNYTGDRLNFGLAAEQAKSEGYKIEMVIVGDDCALPPPRGIAGRRGLAGTILVHKVAGAAADAGLSLADVAAEAKHASEVVGTMGVALSVCTLPGQVTSDRLGPKQMELGLGIHGEPGVAVVDLQTVDVVVEHILKQILSQETQYLPITRGSNAVLLINGLGATPIMELMIAARKAVPELQLEYGIAVDRVYTGSLMTSLDMAGFSITIMKSDENILQRLDAPTKAPAWPVGSEGNRPPAKFPIPVPPSPSVKDDEMYRGAAAILEDMKKRYPMNDAAGTINEIGATIRRVMGGTSGILYDILCKAAYASLKQNTTITANEWSDALEASVAAISKYGGASIGYRTMLDALIPASTVLKQRLKAGDDPVAAFIASSEAASAGAESTKQMQAKACTLTCHTPGLCIALETAGRSSYIAPDLLASIPDPGAMAAAACHRARFRRHRASPGLKVSGVGSAPMAARGKKLINDPNDVVTQFIEGLVETYPGLQYLNGFPEVKVVLRADVAARTYDKVAVICAPYFLYSGGGSGHEPAHGGFVGQGMLTAAVSGDVFTAPPVNSILANYTGDRLNFGLAAEEAKSEGYRVEMVIVGDDCALPPTQGIVGKRGLAGTILVNKIAGAAADAGLSLEAVAEEARHASRLVGTMGIALSVCTLPGQETSDRLGPEQMELGLGLHGEPGAAVTELQPVDVVVARVLKQILLLDLSPLHLHHVIGFTVSHLMYRAILIYRLGATPVMELMIATRKVVRELQLEYGIATDRVYTGSFMTSLDMQGSSRQKPAKIAVPVSSSGAMKSDKMYRGATAILEDMKKWYPMNDAAQTVNEIGATVRRVMGGTTGILYDILCKAAYASLKSTKTVEAKDWCNALEASICAISKYGGAHEGYRTMLDALIPASKILREVDSYCIAILFS